MYRGLRNSRSGKRRLAPLRISRKQHQNERLPQTLGLARWLLHVGEPVQSIDAELGWRWSSRVRAFSDAQRLGRAHDLLRPLLGQRKSRRHAAVGLGWRNGET